MEKGGALSMQLGSLYRYVMEQLSSGNRHNDLKALDQAEHILTTLKEGFETAMTQQKSAVVLPAQETAAASTKGMEGVSCAV